MPDLPEARAELNKYLKLGARGIGEQKFGVDCDSVHIERKIPHENAKKLLTL